MRKSKKVRYAVLGLGHIAQVAVLPAFRHARRNSELRALISDDPEKLQSLGKKYRVSMLYTEDQLEELLASGEIDALYIATPNTEHNEPVRIAAKHGVHVLCEKPLASTTAAAREILELSRRANIRVMTAYRLHFNVANLTAAKIARSGKLGELRTFNSVFSVPVRDPQNIRLQRELGGGPLYDLGVYCINAARYLFGEEPIEVFAMSESLGDRRFREVDEMTSVVMRYPGNRLANFTVSFGGADVGYYELLGTRGSLCLDQAYDYATEMELSVTIGEKTQTREYKKRDQFAPELIYFSECVLRRRKPEPSAEEGLADVRIVEAIRKSARVGRPVSVAGQLRDTRQPTLRQRIDRPAVRPPRMVHAASASSRRHH